MARARNIKPSFFQNENIVELSFEARLLFIGLWTLADREGRLENRPKKIKMSLFPADDINVAEQLENISKLGFIELYNADDIDVIQIVNFVKHQNPHGLEKDSELPDQNGIYTVYHRNPKNKTITGNAVLVTKTELKDFYDKTGNFSANKAPVNNENSFQVNDSNGNNGNENTEEQLDNSSETVLISDRNALNPESFNLNPDSLNPENNICSSDDEHTHVQNSNEKLFEEFWEAYPKKQQKKTAFEKFKKINFKKYPFEKIMNALEQQKSSSQWLKENGQFIPMPSTWIHQERWNDLLELPPNLTMHEQPPLPDFSKFIELRGDW
ncbi:hypothetical protein OHW93_17000 [Acinetobacter baumannii]|nr:hypothetical protein [Acinetobacter baumannii]